MNIEWKYNITEKILTLKLHPLTKDQFTTLLTALNKTVKKGEAIEGEYEITP